MSFKSQIVNCKVQQKSKLSDSTESCNYEMLERNLGNDESCKDITTYMKRTVSTNARDN